MYNPPHPGSLLKEDFLPSLGLSVGEAAKQLGVARVTLSRMINGRAAISAEMALRLEKLFKNPSAESWLNMQNAYNLWQARQKLNKAA
jgi:addiction module HigA family antidote